MKVSVQQAERMTGKSRTKIYKDIKNGALTTEKNSNGKVIIDVSELSRVYDIVSTNPNDKMQPIARSTQNNTHEIQTNTESIEVKYLEAQIEILEKERNREREQLESRIDSLEETLKRSQDTTLLLEKKDNGTSDWQKSVTALEDRIANQEKQSNDATKEAEKLAKEKEELKAQLEEKEQKLKEEQEALELEKAKSFLHKIFGK